MSLSLPRNDPPPGPKQFFAYLTLTRQNPPFWTAWPPQTCTEVTSTPFTNLWNGVPAKVRVSFNRTVVLHYRIHLESRHLTPGTINLRLGAVHQLAYEAADGGLLGPDLAGDPTRSRIA